MMRIPLIILSVLAPFWFPWPIAIALILITAFLHEPFLALFMGILIDLVYFMPDLGIPYASILGVVGFGVALVVHRFMKTRIIGG